MSCFNAFIFFFFFFFNDTATTEIYTLSLHDALPICAALHFDTWVPNFGIQEYMRHSGRSEEHTSELQSRRDLVCRLLLEKKKKKKKLKKTSKTYKTRNKHKKRK